jgi:hypothetical protein
LVYLFLETFFLEFVYGGEGGEHFMVWKGSHVWSSLSRVFLLSPDLHMVLRPSVHFFTEWFSSSYPKPLFWG